MQMSLNDILDRKPILPGFFYINPNIPLRIDNRRDPLGAQHIGGMRQTGEIELLEIQ
jgi:hypothetical protein